MAFNNFLRYCSTLLLAASGSRVSISSENLAARSELCAELTDSKSITYIRHGESTGNAHLGGMIHTLSLFNFHADGVLMPKGERQVKNRVDLMGNRMLARVVDAEVILVSPLRRALGTAILFVAHAHHQNIALHRKLVAHSESRTENKTDNFSASSGVVHADCSVDSEEEGYHLPSDHRWPTMQVVAELREKIQSLSEIPESGIGAPVREYVTQLAENLGKRLFCNEAALAPMVQELLLSYERDRSRTAAWTAHHGNIGIPTDGVQFGKLIRAFTKEMLPARHEKRLVIVGHSGWARFAFAHLLPLPTDAMDEPLDNLANFKRTTVELNNAGILPLCFHHGIHTLEWPDEPLPENEDFLNFKSKSKVSMLTLLPDARFVGVIPDDAIATQFYLKSEALLVTQVRIVTISASKSKRVIYCTRSNEWGVPQETVTLDLLNTYVYMFNTLEVRIKKSGSGKIIQVETTYNYVFNDSSTRRCFYNIVRWYRDLLASPSQNAPRPQCEGAVHVD